VRSYGNTTTEKMKTNKKVIIEKPHVTVLKEMIMKFPQTPNLTLAKLFVKRYPKFYIDVESARKTILKLKGASGDLARKHQYKDFRAEFEKLKKELPKGETEKVEPYYLPTSIRRILVLSDIHFPFQNDEALFAALEFGNQKDVDCIYLNGDVMDMYQLSRHEKNPYQRDFKYERDCTRVFLKGIRNMFPNTLIVYKIGNHDERYEKWIMKNSPEIYDEQYMSLGSVLGFTELKIIEVKSKQFAYAGKLPILHGHELPMRSGGDNPANLSKKRLGKQAIFGHFHKTTQANGREFDKGMSYAIYSTGCLCDLNPNYMPINEWNHGFAYIEIDANGKYSVENKTILDGKIY
jgi:predicted phosphodiesterase